MILATVPVGLSGLLLEHLLRTVLGKPAPAAVFLAVNGLVLAVGERLRRRVEEPTPVLSATDGLVRDEAPPTAGEADDRLARLPGRAVLIGSAQILALSPGISRSGVTMVAGPVRGLAHEDAARFSFLLATPVILAAGALKIPDLTGPLAAGVHGLILAGSITSFLSCPPGGAVPHPVLPHPHGSSRSRSTARCRAQRALFWLTAP